MQTPGMGVLRPLNGVYFQSKKVPALVLYIPHRFQLIRPLIELLFSLSYRLPGSACVAVESCICPMHAYI